jgi:hypothetical protein
MGQAQRPAKEVTMRTLSVTSGPAAGTTIEVEREIVIGRDSADLTIPDPQLSRRHTRVRPVGGGLEIMDLGSLNGTFVNGERIEEPVTLTTDGTLYLGTSRIDIALDAAGAPDAAAAAAGSVKRIVEEPAAPAAPAAAAASAVAAGAATPAAPGAVPPAAGPPPAAPPRPPTPGPQPGAEPAARPRSKLPLLLGLLALLAAGAIAAGVLLTRDDDDDPAAGKAAPAEKSRRLVASMDSALLVNTTKKMDFGGTVTQVPGGAGAVVGKLTLKGDVTKGKAVPVSGTIVFRFVGGRINTTVTGTALQRKDETRDLTATGKIVSGTRQFEGATGSFKLRGAHDPLNPTVAHSTISGTIKY